MVWLSAVAVNKFMKETILVVILSSETDTERNKTDQLLCGSTLQLDSCLCICALILT